MVEIARKICKRLHAYLRMDRYAGKVHSVYPDHVLLETPIGMVSILTNAHCLHPFSAVISSTKELLRFAIEEGQEALLGEERIEIPACGFAVDLSQATDFDLSVGSMQTLFLPTDLDIRARHLLRVIETLSPIQAEYDRICADKAYLQQVMDSGRDRAAAIAHRTMLKVRKKLGIAPWKL